MLGAQFRLCHAVCPKSDSPSGGVAFYPHRTPGTEGPMSSAPAYSPGVMKYVEAAKKLLTEREAALAPLS